MVIRGNLAKLKQGIGLLLSGAEEGEDLVALAPTVSVRELVLRFWPYARPFSRRLPLILVLVAVGPAIESATIWMYKVLVDKVLVPRDFELLLWVLIAYLGLMLAEGFVTFSSDYLTEWVGGRFVVSLRTDLFRHLQGLSLGFFERRSLGDMIS